MASTDPQHSGTERPRPAAADAQRQQPTAESPPRQVRDLPGCIKYILLLLLLALLFVEWWAGEFSRARELGFIVWLILLIKLILIIGLIILIWVQRKLRCDLTGPVGCATPEYDVALDKWVVRVTGTATGVLFGSYTLSVERPPGTPFPVPVIYPGGGSSGTAPVVSGELGRLDVSNIQPGPMRVILRVHPSGAGSDCVHTTDFDIMNRIVWIEKIGAVPARVVGTHPSDSSEVLKLVKVNPDPPLPALPGPEASIAAGVSVEGGADVYGCGRQMVAYALQYREVPAAMPVPWQMDDPGPGWQAINPALPFGPPGDPVHPRTFLWLFGMVWENYIRHGRLTRVWSVAEFLMTLSPTTTAPRPYTAETAWDTTGLNGRFTVRLVVTHDVVIGPPFPTDLYDSATVWLDNRPIEARITHLGITGGGAIGVCDELSLSQFITPDPLGTPTPPGPFSKVNATINGRAWDPIILDSYSPSLIPNDNFDRYDLIFKKNGEVSWETITTSTTRVPNILQQSPLPALPGGIGVLHEWDIVDALDAGPMQAAPAPYPKIYRGERCAYLIRVRVWDTTRIGDSGQVHYAEHDFPFCIMNDIPDDVPFPVP